MAALFNVRANDVSSAVDAERPIEPLRVISPQRCSSRHLKTEGYAGAGFGARKPDADRMNKAWRPVVSTVRAMHAATWDKGK
jgi:hypothetical protein